MGSRKNIKAHYMFSNEEKLYNLSQKLSKIVQSLTSKSDESLIIENCFSREENSIDIKQELIYVASIAGKQIFLDNYTEKITKVMYIASNKDTKKLNELKDKIYDLREHFMDYGAFTLLKCPKYTEDIEDTFKGLMMKELCPSSHSYVASNAVLSSIMYWVYNNYIELRNCTRLNFDYCIDDELLECCVYTVLYWVMSNNCKYNISSDIEKLIKDTYGETWDNAIDSAIKRGNRYAEAYKKFKLDQTEDTEKEFAKFIYTDSYKMDLDEYNFDKCNEMDELVYYRATQDSFKNILANDEVPELYDIDDKFCRIRIHYLLNRYLQDTVKTLISRTFIVIKDSIERCNVCFDCAEQVKEVNDEIQKVKQGYKIKNSKLKKELDDALKELKYQKEKNSKLTKKLDRTTDDKAIKLEKEIERLNTYIIDVEKTNNKSSFEVERLENKLKESDKKINDLTNELNKIKKDTETKTENVEQDEINITALSRDINVDALYNSIKHKKILLIGGNKIHSVLSSRGYNNIECVDASNVNINLGQNIKYDVVVIYTKLIGHSTIHRVESEIKSSGVPVIRFNEKGVNMLIYRIFNFVYCGDGKEYGEYYVE